MVPICLTICFCVFVIMYGLSNIARKKYKIKQIDPISERIREILDSSLEDDQLYTLCLAALKASDPKEKEKSDSQQLGPIQCPKCGSPLFSGELEKKKCVECGALLDIQVTINSL